MARAQNAREVAGLPGRVFAGDCEMRRHVGEREALQLARRDIIQLGEQESVHEMPAMNLELRIFDSLLRDLKARGAAFRGAAIAAPREREFGGLRARHERRHDFFEKIVALDDVGIVRANDFGEALECGAAAFQRDILLPAGVVRQSDRVRGHRDLHAAQLGKRHALEKGAAGPKEKLLDGIAEAEVADARAAQAGAKAGEVPPVLALGEESECEAAGKAGGREGVVGDFGVGPKIRLERLLDDRGGPVGLANVEGDPGAPGQLGRNDALLGVMAEKGLVIGESHPRIVCARRRGSIDTPRAPG